MIKYCKYCKKKGHIIEDCYIRKNKTEKKSNDPNTSQNTHSKNANTLPVQVAAPRSILDIEAN